MDAQAHEVAQKVITQGTKFIVITGGVCSSLGKGVLLSSLGTLLKEASYTVSVIKCDPYLNVDPGTMSPLVHGEVFVTKDGAETDLDLGHYERVLDIELTKKASVTSGHIFQTILDGEREGRYLGKCIQLVPHVVDAIKDRLFECAQSLKPDFVLIEIGGTVGDMEGEVFLESIRQLRLEYPKQFLHCHLSYVPILSWTGEVKTKPTQHSMMLLKKAGLTPDMLFLRIDKRLEHKTFEKLALMCGVARDMIFEVLTFDPLYKLFLDLERQGVHQKIQEYCGFDPARRTNTTSWGYLIERIEKEKPSLRIGLIAKYLGKSDPYLSVIEAIKAAGYHNMCDVEVVIIPAHALEDPSSQAWELLESVAGIVIPGGFDKKGLEGKIGAARYAREKQIPYLGLCLGLHVMLIDIARHCAGLEKATTTEVDSDASVDLISLLEDQEDVLKKGGSMRLGSYPCALEKNTHAYKAYGKELIFERHRHRYEFNNRYRESLEEAGVVFSGIFKEKNLVEIAELKEHPFMLATQFHPEFTSRPLTGHPLFNAFIKAAKERKNKGL